MKRQLQERLKLLRRVENLGRPITKSIARQISAAGVAAVTTGQVHIPTGPIVEQVVDLMLLGYVKRYRMQRNALELSFETEVRKAARGLDLDLGSIGDSFTRHTRDRVAKATSYYEERISAALAEITAEQLPTRRAVIEMRQALSDMQLSPVRPAEVETLVRTHAQMAFGAAQWQLNQNDPHGLITGYEFSAVDDDRTTDECASLNGKLFAVNDPVLDTIWPPNHYNCRSQLIEQTDPIEPSDVPASVIASAVDDGFDFNPGQLLDE